MITLKCSGRAEKALTIIGIMKDESLRIEQIVSAADKSHSARVLVYHHAKGYLLLFSLDLHNDIRQKHKAKMSVDFLPHRTAE